MGCFLLRFLQFFSFYKFVSATKVYSGSHDRFQNILVEIIRRLSQNVNVVRQSNEEDCHVSLVFCPIVSRTGTDIEAALSSIRADMPTLVLVLHHTFNPEYTAPDSSKYGNNNLMLVDILFHEDSGLLDCVHNNEALIKAEKVLQKYGKTQLKVNTKRVLTVCAAGIGIYVLCKKLLRPVS